MDVRCEKCGTEYELDETRLKPGGVTVKCTSCGHMFKIRKRAATNVGIPVVSTPQVERGGRPSEGPGRPAGAPRAPTSTGAPRAQTSTGGSAGVPRAPTSTGAPGSGPTGERSWIVRMANGEQRTCRELAALQQWIVSGLVRRDSMISRSGKTWKQLGDIPELAQFFTVADEARDVRTRRDSGRVTAPQQVRDRKPTPEVKQTLLGLGTAVAPPEPAKRRPATQPPPPPRSLAAHAGPMAPLPSLATPAANDVRPRPEVPIQAKAPVVPAVPRPQAPVPGLKGDDARATGAWASEELKPLAMEPGQGPAGPFGGAIRKNQDAGFGGAVRAVPTHDAAFTGSVGHQSSVTFSRPPPRASGAYEELSPGEMFDDETGPVLKRGAGGGIGKWIAVGSLVLIAGAAAAIYFIVVRQPTRSAAAVRPVPGEVEDGGALAAGDGGAATPDQPPADDAIAAAREVLAGDVATSLDATAAELAGGAQEAPELAMRARLATAVAQQLEDQAALAGDSKKADPLRKDARKRVAAAMTLAQKAVKIAPAGSEADVLAKVAMADVLRLQGKPVKEVQVHLGRALELAPKDREAMLVSALLSIRDDKPADARKLLEAIERDATMEMSGDVRPRFRMAMLAFASGDVPAAQKAAEDVLALQAEHAGAQALLARLRDAVETSDPMPREEVIDAGVRVSSGSGSAAAGSGSGSAVAGSGSAATGSGSAATGSGPSGDYDSLLGKADRLAEVNCADAMPYYNKALELKPNGVAALTGRGYCFIDSKQFSSAHSSFRAALAVSRRYEPALWGIGEAYQQQGLKDKAIEAYQNYLEAYPGAAKAIKQIDRLGGTVEGSDSSGGAKGRVEPRVVEPDPPAED